MANNNNLLFNAAVAGFLEGTFAQRSINDAVAGDYAPQANAAAAFATEVDSLIALDGTISGAGGVTLPPTTAAIQDAQVSKTNLLEGICSAVFSGRYSVDPISADYATIAAAIVALYAEGVSKLAVG